MKKKVASTDFTKDSLPHNRFEVFIDKFRVQYKIFFYIGLTLFVFSLPLLLLLIFKDSLIMQLIEQEELTEEVEKFIELIYSLVNSICLGILGLGLSGIFRVIRSLLFDEPVFYKEDFYKGFKNNSKLFFTIGLLTGLIYSAIEFIGMMNESVTLLSSIPFFIYIIIIIPIVVVSLIYFTIYNSSLFEGLKNSGYLFIKNFFIFIPFIILLFSFSLLLLVNNIIIKYFGLILSTIFIIPIFIVIFNLICNYVFDKEINKTMYPEIFDKGIYRK